MKKLFISREIEKDHAFAKRISAAGLELIGRSLIQFSPIPFTKIPDSDWIFFYSKQGIRYYFDQLDNPSFWSGLRMGMPLKVKSPRYATFGKGSARFLKLYRNNSADFVGTGNANENAKAFLKLAKGKRVLFVRGQNSLQSIQELLKEEKVETAELIVYNNTPLSKFSLPQAHYLVFTSPLNAKVYYQRYKVKGWQKVYAIGETTAKALLSLGVGEVSIAKSPSLDQLAELVLESIS